MPIMELASTPVTRREMLLACVAVVSTLFAAAVQFSAVSPPPAAMAEVVPAVASTTFSQTGRTVIVTGSSKGIGRGVAKTFAEAGANVLINSRHIGEAEAAAEEIVAAGGVASAFACDVSVESDVVAMMEAAVSRYGGIDVVHANAGVMPDVTMDQLTASGWDAAFDVNVKGVFLTVKHALPHLRRSPFGRVILTSSITGPITGFPGWTHCAPSRRTPPTRVACTGSDGAERSTGAELVRQWR
jgi:hypothetical protein